MLQTPRLRLTPVERTTIHHSFLFTAKNSNPSFISFFPTLNGFQWSPQKKEESSKDSLGLLRILISILHLIVFYFYLSFLDVEQSSCSQNLESITFFGGGTHSLTLLVRWRCHQSTNIISLNSLPCQSCLFFSRFISVQPFCQTRP